MSLFSHLLLNNCIQIHITLKIKTLNKIKLNNKNNFFNINLEDINVSYYNKESQNNMNIPHSS